MEIILKATKRKELGKKVKRLRKGGNLPANIYGKKVKSQAISVSLKNFEKVYKEAGETNVVYVELDGERRPALIHNVQKDPVYGNFLHADFYQVDLKEKVVANVPITLVRESPVEKQGLGTLVQYLSEVEVEALPTDIPENFEVDVSKISEIDQQILVKDLSFDTTKVDIKTELESVIVRAEPLRKEEVEIKTEEVSAQAQEEAGEVEEGKERLEQQTEAEENEKGKSE